MGSGECAWLLQGSRRSKDNEIPAWIDGPVTAATPGPRQDLGQGVLPQAGTQQSRSAPAWVGMVC